MIFITYMLNASSCLVRPTSQPSADRMQDNTVSIATKDTIFILAWYSENFIQLDFSFHVLVYVELGAGVSDSAELNFEFADVIGNRQFEMKVTQIICNSRMR